MKFTFFLLLCLTTQIAFGKNYYVSDSGNDKASGTTESAAWKSLEKVNNAIKTGKIGKGDKILFRRGNVFRGSLVISDLSGVTFTSFGEGEMPVISGNIVLTKNWKVYHGHIWFLADTSLPENVRKLSINGKYTEFGRWPDRPGEIDGPEYWREYCRPKGNYQFDDKTGLNVPDNYWNGAEAIIGVSTYGFIIENHKIEKQKGNTFSFKGTSYELYNGDDHYYYLQNHVNALNKNNEWAYKNDTIFLYSTTPPNQLNIEVCNTETTVEIKKSNRLLLENLKISSSNRINALIAYSSNINIANCAVIDGAYDGVRIYDCDSISVRNSVLNNIGNIAIQLMKSKNTAIHDNKIINIGLDRGAGGEGGSKSIGILIESGQNYDIKYNELDSIGYGGITLINHTTFNCTIHYNYIHHFCLTKADGGGIYTWQRTIDHNNGNSIDHNIILQGEDGRNLGMIKNNDAHSFGIYCDDRSDYITVSNNTCIGGKYSLYLHSAANITIRNNTLLLGKFCIVALIDAKSNIEMTNNIISDNKIIFGKNTLRAYYFKDLDDELSTNTIKFENNVMVDLYHPETKVKAVYGYKAIPLLKGELLYTDWKDLKFTSNIKCISGSVLNNSEIDIENQVLFSFNPTKKDSILDLRKIKCINLSGETIIDRYLIKPYESVFLIKTEVK